MEQLEFPFVYDEMPWNPPRKIVDKKYSHEDKTTFTIKKIGPMFSIDDIVMAQQMTSPPQKIYVLGQYEPVEII